MTHNRDWARSCMEVSDKNTMHEISTFTTNETETHYDSDKATTRPLPVFFPSCCHLHLQSPCSLTLYIWESIQEFTPEWFKFWGWNPKRFLKCPRWKSKSTGGWGGSNSKKIMVGPGVTLSLMQFRFRVSQKPTATVAKRQLDSKLHITSHRNCSKLHHEIWFEIWITPEWTPES